MRPLLFCTIAVLIFGSTSCQKKTYPATTAVYTGKVLRSLCGNVMIQFTDGSQMGQTGWKDGSDTTTYNHVFKVANSCTWGGGDVNSAIRFRFAPMVPQSCMQCMAYVAVPDTAYSIEVVK